MNNRIRLCFSALAVLLVLMIPVAAMAQETTSAIRVSLFGPDASPLEGVDVTITDTRTGSIRTAQSNASGWFCPRSSGGRPYTVVASTGSYATRP